MKQLKLLLLFASLAVGLNVSAQSVKIPWKQIVYGSTGQVAIVGVDGKGAWVTSPFVNYADTSAMLSSYATAIANNATQIDLRVQYADSNTYYVTPTQLGIAIANVWTEADTTFVKYTDTAGMLSPLWAAISQRVKYSDTASMLSAIHSSIATNAANITTNTSNIATNTSDIALRELLANKSTSLVGTGNNTNYPTTKAAKDNDIDSVKVTGGTTKTITLYSPNGNKSTSFTDTGNVYTAGYAMNLTGTQFSVDTTKVVPLNAMGKIDFTYIPVEVVHLVGVWDASTNSPTLHDSTGVIGEMYKISNGGTQDLGHGVDTFYAGGFILHDSTIWNYIPDNSSMVVSVNGQQGVVTLNSDNIPEGSTNLYYSDLRARNAITLTTAGSSGTATYNSTTGVLNIPAYASNLGSSKTGNTVTVSNSNGTGTSFSVADSDSSATNEIQNLGQGTGTSTTQPLTISGGGSGTTLNSATTSVAGLMSAADKNRSDSLGSYAIRQNGNSFGTTMRIGTNDNNDVYIKANNTDAFRVNTGGTFRATGNYWYNWTSGNNATFSASDAGPSITRNVADANPGLIVDNANASSTGAIALFRFASSTKTMIDGNGYVRAPRIGVNTTLAQPSFPLDLYTGTTYSQTTLSRFKMGNSYVSIENASPSTGVPILRGISSGQGAYGFVIAGASTSYNSFSSAAVLVRAYDTTLSGPVTGGTVFGVHNYTTPLLDIDYSGATKIYNLSGTGTRIVTASSTGVLSTTSAPLSVANGGTGAVTLTGYVKGNGTSAMTASSTIPWSDISGVPAGTGLTPVQEAFTGSTSTTITLSHAPSTAAMLFITMNGVQLIYGIDATISGSTMTLLSPVNRESSDYFTVSYSY